MARGHVQTQEKFFPPDVQSLRDVYRGKTISNLTPTRTVSGEMQELIAQADHLMRHHRGLLPAGMAMDRLEEALAMAQTPKERREIKLRLAFVHEEVGASTPRIDDKCIELAIAVRLAGEAGEPAEAERLSWLHADRYFGPGGPGDVD